jgi:protein-tyrosine phosphatase
MIEAATLVVTMTRQHLVDIAVAAPRSWQHCFTLADVLHRSAVIGSRGVDETPAAWVRRIGAGRSRSGLLALDLADDVADPMGGHSSAMVQTRDLLAGAMATLGDRLCPE